MSTRVGIMSTKAMILTDPPGSGKTYVMIFFVQMTMGIEVFVVGTYSPLHKSDESISWPMCGNGPTRATRLTACIWMKGTPQERASMLWKPWTNFHILTAIFL